MKTILLRDVKNMKARLKAFDPSKKGRGVHLEMGDGLTAQFSESSRVGQMVLNGRMGPKEVEHYFHGANFSFINNGGSPEFIDFGLAGSFTLEDDIIRAFEEHIGVSLKGESMASAVQTMPGMHKNAFLGGRQAELDVHYKMKGDGGLSRLMSIFTWSHHSPLLAMHSAEIRLLCRNGMAATKAVQGNTVMIKKDFERELGIAEEGFLSKTENAMNDRYSRLMDRALTIRQALNFIDVIKRVSLVLRANGHHQEAASVETIVYISMETLAKTNTREALKDKAFGGAPTRIPAIQAIDMLTETLTHYLPALDNMNSFSLLMGVQKLINELMFEDSGIFVMPAMDHSESDWDPERPFYGV